MGVGQQDPRIFFANTFPTDGLKTLIVEVFGRLAGTTVGSPIIRLETSFGGGKTHDEIALWHIARNGRQIEGLERFANLSLIPDYPIQVAAIACQDLDPINGVYHPETGIRTYTLWGEIAYQIGGVNGYSLLRGSDEQKVSPGTVVLERLTNGQPTLIVLDEIARHLRAAKTCTSVLLICRKRDPHAGQAWWDDLRPNVANLVEQRAPEFEANDITGIDLYLSAFGPALNVFSRNYPILDSSGNEVRPEEAFAEARRAIANYRFYKLAQTDTQGFDPLTTWYMLAWDAFRAREFPFDDARQLALAVGGFNVADLAKTYKLLDSTSGTCKFLTPQQRHKKRAFSLVEEDFTARYLIDALHAIITLYLEEGTIKPVRRFLKLTGLLSNDLFMRSWEVALKVIPRIGDEKKRIPEEKALADLWLAMDEIKAKVVYIQPELELGYGQQSLNFDANEEEA